MISVSGIDSAGKTTQIEFIEKYYESINRKFIRIWGRGSWTPGVEIIKKLVRKDKNFTAEQKAEYRKEARTNPKKSKLLLIASILDLYLYFGIYYRWKGLFVKEVICDRYIWDTCADFRVGFSQFDFENWLIWKLLLKFIPMPRHSFMLVISPEESISRGLKKQEMYMESLENKTKKIQEYFKLIDEGKWTDVIDGNQPIEAINDRIREILGK